MNDLVGITVNDRKAVIAIITIVPCYRNHSVLLCIIADLLVIFRTAGLILTVIIFFIDGTKLADHHRISLGNKFGVHFLELGNHVRFIAPACFLGRIGYAVAPLGRCSGLRSTEIPWIVVMNRDHDSLLSGSDV